MGDVVHVPAGEGEKVWVVGDTYTLKATSAATGGALSLVEASIPPGSFVFIPRGTLHRFRNVGYGAARMLFMFTPAGCSGSAGRGSRGRRPA